ncbi:MAG: UrcA family protein [Terricaulis sp.]
MRRSNIFGIAALLATATALPVVAQEVQPRQRVVPYSDLNLDNPNGAHVMVRRIENASRQVCGDRTGPRGMAESGSVNACRVESAENAVNDLDHPMVTAEYYGNRSGNVVVTEDNSTVYDDSGAPVIVPTDPNSDGASKGY